MQRQATTGDVRDGRGPSMVLEQYFPEFVIDSLPCAFFVINSELRFVRWNRNFRILTGYSDREIMVMDVRAGIVEDRRDAVARMLRQALDGDAIQGDMAFQARDGRIVSQFVTVQRAAIGDVVCLIGTGWDGAHRMATEQNLPDERNLVGTLINNLPDAVYVKDRQSRFMLCNREVLRRKGVGSLEEIVGKTDFDFYPGEMARDVFDAEQELMRTGTAMINRERCVIDKVTGRPTWNLTTKVPFRNDENEIVGLVGIGRDVTERKRAEEAYHAIVDHSLQGLIVIQDMRIAFANEAMAEISGYTVEEMQTAGVEQLRDFIHPMDRRMVWEHHRARLEGESSSLPDRYEFRVIRKDGSVRWLEINTSRVEYQGRPAIQAACIDTTERRRAQMALQRSEARNLALLNAIPDLMFRLSHGGVFLDCKPPKDDAISAAPAQFIGKHLDEVFPAAVTRALMRHIRAAVETGQVQTLDYTLPGNDGEDSEFECRLVACAEQEVVAIVRDISDRRRVERLARLQRDAATRLCSLSDLKEGLQYCLEAAVQTSKMDAGGIYTVDEHTGCLMLDVHLGLSEDFIESASLYPPHSRNARLVMKGEPIYTTFDRLGVPTGPGQRSENLRAVAIIPIRRGDRVVACLNVTSRRIDEVPSRSRVVLETIAAQVGSVISRLKIQEALQRAEREKAIILNAMTEIVTYHDLSHRMIWANRTALEALSKSAEEIVGRRCYELWEGATMPCTGCPVDLALQTGCSQETEIVGYNGGTWLVRGEPVRDDAGRLLGVVELAIDITRRKRDEEELRRRLQFEGLIASISTDLANLPTDQIEAGIERTLAGIGGFVQADRCHVHLFHDDGSRVSKVHEWGADGIARTQGQGWNVETKGVPVEIEALKRAGILSIPSVRELQGPQARMKEFLEATSVKSLLCAPIMIGGELFGMLGVSAVQKERAWPNDAVPLLKTASEIVANALERRRSADAMRQRLAFKTLLSELSATFIGLPAREIDDEIERWLARIGEGLGIDRETVVQFAGDNATVTHSWVTPEFKRTSSAPTGEDLGWVMAQMRKGITLAYARIEDMPVEAQREREYCLREGIKSIVAMPLEVAGAVLGAVLLSSIRTRRDWSDEVVPRLRLLGQVFANAMLRRRAEEALQASETRLKSIIRAAPAGIGLMCDRVLVDVNDRVCEMVGYGREELLHQSTRILYPTDEDYDRIEREKYVQISERGIGTVETRWRRKDGQVIDVLLRTTPLNVDDPSQGVTFVALDITESKRAEAALRESESRFRDLADLLPQTIFEVDMQGFFTFANRAGLERFGYTEQEAPHVHVLQTLVPADRERAAENLRRKLAGEEVFSSAYTALCKDGRTFPVLLYSAPILREGSLAGLRGIVVDITELKQAEAALRESEQNYRQIFNATNDAVFIHDATTGDILDVNKTALETFGYAPEEVQQFTRNAAGTGEPPYTRQDAVAWIRKTAAEGPQLFEWLARKKNGDFIWEEVSLRTAVISGERRVLAVARDITDRKKTEEQVQLHLAELTRAWHANTLGELASGLAHELNQPLCAIVNYSNGCLRLIRKEGYSMETVRESIERIAVQAQRAADILKRIRSLIARHEPQRTELHLDSILAGAVYLLKDEADRNNVAIISRLQANLPRVKGDSVEIEQVVLNLMRNAIETMNDPQISRRTLTISSGLPDPGRIEVAVADSGRGISPELSEKIFDSFFTTKPQGLGIGLSLSRRIVEAHGGRLWAESDGRTGATFKFTLPVEGGPDGA